MVVVKRCVRNTPFTYPLQSTTLVLLLDLETIGLRVCVTNTACTLTVKYNISGGLNSFTTPLQLTHNVTMVKLDTTTTETTNTYRYRI